MLNDDFFFFSFQKDPLCYVLVFGVFDIYNYTLVHLEHCATRHQAVGEGLYLPVGPRCFHFTLLDKFGLCRQTVSVNHFLGIKAVGIGDAAECCCG